jgi:hypothetical protein
MQKNLGAHVAVGVFVAEDLGRFVEAAFPYVVLPERIDERLVGEEATDASDSRLVENIEKVALQSGVTSAFEGRLFDYGGS